MSDTNNPNAAEKAAKIRRKPERESVLTPTFAAARQPAPDRQQTQPSGDGLLQRQCSCGQHTIGGGVCEECQQKQGAASFNPLDELNLATPPDIQTSRDSAAHFNLSHIPAQARFTANGQPIQPALTVNAPGDQYEQEADRVAEAVMRMPDPTLSSTKINAYSSPTVSRLPAISQIRTSGGSGAFQAPTQVEARISQMQGGGQPLPDTERDFFESRMGYDFSQVRIHTDANAVQASRDVQAQAFTVGNNIAFNEGTYRPETNVGRHLLAHELTHVVQQGAVSVQRDALIQRRRAPYIRKITVHLTPPQSADLEWVGTPPASATGSDHFTVSTGKGYGDPGDPPGTCTRDCCDDPMTQCAPPWNQPGRVGACCTYYGRNYWTGRPRKEHNGWKWWTPIQPYYSSRGIALHQHHEVTGQPIGHGCVRMEEANAKRIYDFSNGRRTNVTIDGRAAPVACDPDRQCSTGGSSDSGGGTRAATDENLGDTKNTLETQEASPGLEGVMT